MDQPQSHSPIHSALSSHYHKYFHSSPKHINYNSYISDHSPKAKGKYRLRNCRQPKLKIETEAETKLSSYKDLKEIMRQKIQKESLKKQYDRYCQGVDDTDVIQKLRTELNFFNSQKIPHKNRYRPNKKSNYMSSLLDVSGKKMEKLEGKHE